MTLSTGRIRCNDLLQVLGPDQHDPAARGGLLELEWRARRAGVELDADQVLGPVGVQLVPIRQEAVDVQRRNTPPTPTGVGRGKERLEVGVPASLDQLNGRETRE